ncbi:hypothetical protein J6590_056729 [Homalodisca vitripennis]|nr:hypothetical protein J6590_056729 [Homalodisca vitripennis]
MATLNYPPPTHPPLPMDLLQNGISCSTCQKQQFTGSTMRRHGRGSRFHRHLSIAIALLMEVPRDYVEMTALVKSNFLPTEPERDIFITISLNFSPSSHPTSGPIPICGIKKYTRQTDESGNVLQECDYEMAREENMRSDGAGRVSCRRGVTTGRVGAKPQYYGGRRYRAILLERVAGGYVGLARGGSGGGGSEAPTKRRGCHKDRIYTLAQYKIHFLQVLSIRHLTSRSLLG